MPANRAVAPWRPVVQLVVAAGAAGVAAAALALASLHAVIGGPVLLAALVGLGAVLVVRRWPALVEPGSLRWAVAVGVVVRLLFAFVAQTRPESDFLVFWDEAGALGGSGALSVLQDSKAPSVVLLYGAGRWLLDDALWVPYLVNALLGGLQVWLVAGIARRLVTSAAVPMGAAWVVALLPSLVAHAAVVSSEVLFTTAMLGTAWLLLWSLTRPTVRARLLGAAGAGALAAVAHFSRNVAVLFLLPWVAAVALVPVTNVRRLLAPVGVCLLTFLGCCLPQAVANLQQSGTVSISSSDAAGTNLLFGTNRTSDGGWNQADVQMLEERGFTSEDPRATARQQAEARRLGLERITDDVGGFLWFAVTDKYDRMWGSDRGGVEWAVAGSDVLDPADDEQQVLPSGRGVERLADAAYLVLLLAGTLGAAVLALGRDVGRRFTACFLCGPVAVTALFHLVWEVQPRYHLPVLPLVAVLAATGVAWLAEHATAATFQAHLGQVSALLRRSSADEVEQPDVVEGSAGRSRPPGAWRRRRGALQAPGG